MSTPLQRRFYTSAPTQEIFINIYLSLGYFQTLRFKCLTRSDVMTFII